MEAMRKIMKKWVSDAYVIYGNSNPSGTIDLADTAADITLYGVNAEDILGISIVGIFLAMTLMISS